MFAARMGGHRQGMPKMAVAYPSWEAHIARYSVFLILLLLSFL